MISVSPELNADDKITQVHITVPGSDWARFQEMVQRGTNLWPDAPDFIKKAADLITSGKVMQSYETMSGERRH